MKTAAPWTLSDSLSGTRTRGWMALGSLLFAVLTAAAAAVSFPLPFSPVPVTLQTFAVLLAGSMLGPVWGPVSQLLYLAAGVAGMPVFANGGAGLGSIAGPTGGYLVGFVPAAWLMGLLARPGASWGRIALGLAVANLALFACGVGHLMLFVGRSATLAVELGFFPFIPGMIAKGAATGALIRSRRVSGWFLS